MKKALSTIVLGCSLSVACAQSYIVNLDGPSESPANASPGIGFGTVDYNAGLHTLQLQVSFSGLTGTVTASHIHAATVNPFAGTAGVATTTPTFAGFPSGVTSGSFSNTLDLTLASSWNPSYITAHGGTTAQAEIDLMAAIAAGKAYWNIHTSTFGGGEIRGFITPVPEPGTMTFAGLGAAALGLRAWRKRRQPGL